MKKLREEKDRELTVDELKDIMRDIEIEESDEEFVEKSTQKSSLKVKFRRPPKTTSEILNTLKDADQRYEQNISYLAGGRDKANLVRSEDERLMR